MVHMCIGISYLARPEASIRVLAPTILGGLACDLAAEKLSYRAYLIAKNECKHDFRCYLLAVIYESSLCLRNYITRYLRPENMREYSDRDGFRTQSWGGGLKISLKNVCQ